MKSIVLSLALGIFALTSSISGLSTQAQSWLAKQSFEDFKTTYGKSYANEIEESERFEIFLQNVDHIAELNLNSRSAHFGITKFSDMTPEEFRLKMLTYRPVDSAERSNVPVTSSNKQLRGSSTPSAFDWRTYGAVTDVKDQGYCGSCWAFSTTETVESAWYLAGNSLTEFSTEQIVQCDNKDGGCNGGDTITAYSYVEKAGGLALATDYPYSATTYAGTTGSCQTGFTVSGGDISGYTYATTPCTSITCNSQDETTLAANLASVAPASICVDASPWQYYTSGVLTNDNSGCKSGYYKLNHCVQLVGYDNSASTPYWIVRNSWNTDWGVDGYIYLSVGENTCGVADEATFVTIA